MQTSGPAVGVISTIIVGTIFEFATITKFVITDTTIAQKIFVYVSNYGTFVTFLSSVMLL
jgi:hypothetical protein